MLKLTSLSLLTSFASICFISLLNCQSSNIWSLGYSTSGSTGLFSPFHMEFKDDSVIFKKIEGGVVFKRETITIANNNNEVLFYTNGSEIYNHENELLENGDMLCLNENLNLSDLFCIDGFNSRKANFVVPNVNFEKRYTLYHSNINVIDGVKPITDTLFTTTIDFGSNSNYFGEIIDKRLPFISDSIVLGTISICPVFYPESFWLSYVTLANKVKLRLIIDNTISKTEVFDLSCDYTSSVQSPETLFSPDGEKFVICLHSGCISLFNFDKNLGTLSLSDEIEFWSENGSNGILGLSFSPNSDLLYVNNTNELYQTRISAGMFEDPVLIDTFNGFTDPLPNSFWGTQLGPDGKIYMATSNGSQYLHAITKPNESGDSCTFIQQYIELPFYNNFNCIPYLFHDLQVDPILNSHSLGMDLSAQLFPNPCNDYLNLLFNEKISGEYLIKNCAGQIISKRAFSNLEKMTIDISQINHGVYFIQIINEKKKVLLENFLKN